MALFECHWTNNLYFSNLHISNNVQSCIKHQTLCFVQCLFCFLSGIRAGRSILNGRQAASLTPFCRDAVGVFYSSWWRGHRSLIGEVLPFCRDAVGIFYNPSRLGHPILGFEVRFIFKRLCLHCHLSTGELRTFSLIFLPTCTEYLKSWFIWDQWDNSLAATELKMETWEVQEDQCLLSPEYLKVITLNKRNSYFLCNWKQYNIFDVKQTLKFIRVLILSE